MKKCKIIGLTGQTGAGKSTVADVLSKKGITVINADKLVRELYRSDSICLKALSAVFGEDILSPEGGVDRKALAERAFSSKKNTELLNSAVHPFVLSLFLKKVGEAAKRVESAVVFDAPQLFECGADLICDYIISVTAKKEVLIKRICSRDNLSRAEAESRINAQYSEKFFIENSDLIIENNSSLSELIEKAEKLAAAFI